MIDFKRRKLDVPATVERLEYDPNRTAFIALIKLCRRRARLHPGAAAPGGRRQVDRRRQGRREAGQRHAAAAHAGRHDRPQRRDEARQGRADRALGRHLRPVRRPRRRAMRSCGSIRASCAWCRRAAWRRSGAVSNPDHIERGPRQGRPQPLARRPPARPRRGHEPGRPPAWRRRRPHHGRPSSGHALGQADQGQARRASNKATDKFIVRSRHAKKK